MDTWLAKSLLAMPMRPPPGRAWRAAGACTFARDPDVPAAQEPVLWRPELFPGTAILSSAPAGFENATPIELEQFGPVLADRATADGRVVAIGDDDGELHLWLPDKDAARPAAVILPLEPTFELRVGTALRLFRRLMGRRGGMLPAALHLTAQQKARLIQLLHAFDIHNAGGGARAIAAEVLKSEQAALPSVEWKDSAARRKAARLIADAGAMVKRGYLKILSGKFR